MEEQTLGKADRPKDLFTAYTPQRYITAYTPHCSLSAHTALLLYHLLENTTVQMVSAAGRTQIYLPLSYFLVRFISKVKCMIKFTV